MKGKGSEVRRERKKEQDGHYVEKGKDVGVREATALSGCVERIIVHNTAACLSLLTFPRSFFF
jgi:hypothetical protein